MTDASLTHHLNVVCYYIILGLTSHWTIRIYQHYSITCMQYRILYRCMQMPHSKCMPALQRSGRRFKQVRPQDANPTIQHPHWSRRSLAAKFFPMRFVDIFLMCDLHIPEVNKISKPPS